MYDPLSIAVICGSVLATLLVTSVALLKGWRGWLDLKRMEIDRDGGRAVTAASGGRIEIADLRERVRKLEAIAAGIDV